MLQLIYWKIRFKLSGLEYYPIGGGGGGDEPDEPTAPAPAPAPDETSAQAIQAQIDATPEILASQQEFGPQFKQLELDQLNEFGPQFAQAGLDLSEEFGGQFAEQVIKEQDILDPSRAAGSRALTDFLEAGPEALSAEDRNSIVQSSRDAQGARGLSQSGFSADDEVARIFGARQGLKNRYLNVALSASGRLPAAQTGASVSPGNTNTGQLVQNVSPTTFFGGQAAQNASNNSIFNTQSDIFGTQSTSLTARRGQNMSLVGDLGSSFLQT